MPRKQNVKDIDNIEDNAQNNETPETAGNTPISGQNGARNAQNGAKQAKNASDPDKADAPDTGVISGDYIDSDSTDIADSLTKILSVPTETIQTDNGTSETREDVLQGFGGPSQEQPVNPNFKSQGDEGGYEEDFAGGGGDEEGYFEDNELLAQIGVELIDMMFTYGAMAIARDFDNEEKYSIKDKRKKKLEAPLQKILENREVKTAPELVFAFMLVVSYSPIMIEAVQTRRQKAKQGQSGAVKSSPGVVTESVKKRADDFSDYLSVEPQPSEEVQTPDDEDVMQEALQNFKPKRKTGRPVGASDLKIRASMDEDERNKQIQKAKALRKDGWAFSRIAKELNVSQATATRWIRS